MSAPKARGPRRPEPPRLPALADAQPGALRGLWAHGAPAEGLLLTNAADLPNGQPDCECTGCVLEDVLFDALELPEARFADTALRRCGLTGAHLEKGAFTRVRFEGVRLSGASLAKSFFTDVSFVRCDLSNADLRGCSLAYVSFEDCRLTGADFGEAALSDALFTGCACGYTQFSRARLQNTRFERCDCAGAAFHEVRWRALSFETCSLMAAELFLTPLEGLDLTTWGIDGLIVDPPSLRGAIVTAEQACGLAKLLGLVIR